MKKLILGLCGALAFGLTTGHAQAALPGNFLQEPSSQKITVNGRPDWTAKFDYVRAPFDNRPDAKGKCTSPELGVPNWTGSFTDGASTYCYQMIGTAPSKKAKGTTLTTQTYAFVMKFSNGEVFDPTAINTKCDSVSPYTRYASSPLFNASPIVNGKVNLGSIQYEDAQSVGEWYKFVKADKDYFVNLQDTGKPVVITLDVPANEGTTQTIPGLCSGSIGTVDINWLANQINTATWNVNQISVVLFWNVFQTESGSCCVLGYHTYYQNSSGQTGVASLTAMSNAGIFGGSGAGIQDIHATSHEFGEAINDPFGNNTVPAWGHIGQQPGCQNNLEVGDPLTGTVYDGGKGITLNGFTYHPQELVYFNWFTQQTKYAKYSADDVYSMSGTFSAPAKFC
jgi:hypothetical protein